MSIERIAQPLPGERVLALSPPTADEAVRAWLRRPNMFPGRALTCAALAQRQQWEAGRIAARGQSWVAGVVDGLELICTMAGAGSGLAATRIRVERGRALTAGGEDVVLSRALECSLADVPVVAPPSFFANGGGVSDPNPDGSLRARNIGPALGALAAASLATLPAVGVLVLQPVRVESAPFDRSDPCDRSACDEGTINDAQAFEDWREADAGRLLWYVWPSEWRSAAASDMHLRNALAWTIFRAEAGLPPDEALPWEYPWGAPLALVHLDAQRQPLWVDRASVVRQGGRSRDPRLLLAEGSWSTGAARLPLVSNSRQPSLWQAQIEQFAEQVAAAMAEPAGAERLRDGFARYLPPVGILPRDVFNLQLRHDDVAMRSDFFPVGFDLDAAPVPLDQLDVAVRQCAGLAPLAVAAAESVRVLVPVPLASWEPRLLRREVIDPEFDTTLQRFLLTRARELGARQGLRERNAVLERAITGVRPEVPRYDNDPAALEPETLAPWGPPPGSGGHRRTLRSGAHQHYFERASETFTLSGQGLYAWVHLDPEHPPRTLMLQWRTAGASWEHRAFWGEDLIDLGTSGSPSRARQGDLPQPGRWLRLEVPLASVGLTSEDVLDGMAFTLFDGQAAFGATGKVVPFQTPTRPPGGVQVPRDLPTVRDTPASSGLILLQPIRLRRDIEWFSGELPAGAQAFADGTWEMLTPNDLWSPFEPASGVVPLPAGVQPQGSGAHHDGGGQGLHQHFVESVQTPFAVAANGEWLFCWVYLDPNNPPREVMLQWRRDGQPWTNRAVWGGDFIDWGQRSTAERRLVGGLPPPGQWVRLEVSAAEVGLNGASLAGIAFTLFDGHAVFGACGAFVPASGQSPGMSLETVPEGREWFSGSTPAGAVLQGVWQFISKPGLRAPTDATRTGQVQALGDLYGHPALSVLSAQERAQIYLLGAQGFADYLKNRTDRADDVVDYGFVKVQTDVYRVRQLMLGSTAATRLAVSPALASIAQAETAVASQAQIAGFLTELKRGSTMTPQVDLSGVPASGTVNVAASGATVSNRGVVQVDWSLTATPDGLAIAPRTGTLDAGASTAVTLTASGVADFSISLASSTPGVVVSGSPARFRAAAAQPATGLFSRTEFAFRTPFAAAVPRPPAPLPATKVQNGASARMELALATQVAPIARIGDRAAALATPGDIANAQPGAAQPFVRTTTVAKRLEEPKSKEARDYASQSRVEAIEALLRLHDELTQQDGGLTPGLFAGLDVRGLKGDGFLADSSIPIPANQLSRPFDHFVKEPSLLAKLATLPTRLSGTDPDEAAYFSDTTDLADHLVALMRQVEARVKRYREALVVAQQALAGLRTNQAALHARIAFAEDRLAEARHDVSVTRALITEEEERIAAVNTRRERVLAEEVKFVAFVRAREADNLLATPTHSVDPGLIDPPVPTCLRSHLDVPDELDDMLRVVREAPANWFVSAPPILRRLDRMEPLLRTLQTAQVRALAGIATPLLSVQQAPEVPTALAFTNAKVLGAIQRVATRQAEVLAPRLTALRAFDFTAVANATWQGVRAQAEEVVSFADLAEGGHGRADVARAAAAELQNIRTITACLHAEFSAVPPSLRLDWAEVLSEFDEAPNLRNLANLPRWSEIGYIDRRQMQSYVDWLFAQIEPNQPQAVALINDVVRMCLLLASHSPVDRIIAGRLPKPIPGVKPGLHIPITVVDPGRLRVGMHAVLMREQVVVARAVVQDVGRLEVSAQVVHTKDAQVDLGTDVRVHFDDAATLSLKDASAKRSLFGR